MITAGTGVAKAVATANKGINNFDVSSSDVRSISNSSTVLLSTGLVEFAKDCSGMFVNTRAVPSSGNNSFSAPMHVRIGEDVRSVSCNGTKLFLSIRKSRTCSGGSCRFANGRTLCVSGKSVYKFELELHEVSRDAVLSIVSDIILTVGTNVALAIPSATRSKRFC